MPASCKDSSLDRSSSEIDVCLAEPVRALVADGPAVGTIRRILEAARLHLGMDVAFLSEFVAGRRIFRAVSAAPTEAVVRTGDSDPLEETICQRIADGRLPQLMPDARRVPAAMELPAKAARPVGAHLSVPLKLRDGRVYGTFCCMSSAPNLSLNDRDLQVLRAFADLALHHIERELESTRSRDAAMARVRSALERQLCIVYQPIRRIDDGAIVGLECLTRICTTPYRPPDVWFKEAVEVGMGVELELAAIETALQGSQALGTSAYLAINASPAAVLCDKFASLLDGLPASRLVLEITEHSVVTDYQSLLNTLKALRSKGVRLAVDDAGAGYSGLRHILALQPDLIKLDMDLTRNIDADPARRALAAALLGFGQRVGAQIVAEGVETASELATLRDLGFTMAQGYLLSRPLSLENAAILLGRDR
jgi:EAL domain-containing protein (putative c-di-GMP-specific phosphodiesterase class I)